MTIDTAPGAFVAIGILARDCALQENEHIRVRGTILTDDEPDEFLDDLSPDELTDERDVHVTWSHSVPENAIRGTYHFVVSRVFEGEEEEEILLSACENNLIVHER